MFIEPPAREAVLPLNAARRTGPRCPCYGWLSESEDEEEEQPTGQKHEVHVLSLVERAQYIDGMCTLLLCYCVELLLKPNFYE
jgi:hypothetical protein